MARTKRVPERSVLLPCSRNEPDARRVIVRGVAKGRSAELMHNIITRLAASKPLRSEGVKFDVQHECKAADEEFVKILKMNSCYDAKLALTGVYGVASVPPNDATGPAETKSALAPWSGGRFQPSVAKLPALLQCGLLGGDGAPTDSSSGENGGLHDVDLRILGLAGLFELRRHILHWQDTWPDHYSNHTKEYDLLGFLNVFLDQTVCKDRSFKAVRTHFMLQCPAESSPLSAQY